MSRAGFRAVLVASTGLLTACGSPVNDDRIEALGAEANGVPPSDLHRSGQPCVLCHDAYEGASPAMAVGGTVFATRSNPVPVEGAIVTLTDSAGSTKSVTTNCTGNFFLSQEEWQPAFPLRAEVSCPTPGTDKRRRFVMGTRIGRDGSCASCHDGTPSPTSTGWIYCADRMPDPPFTVSDSCPVKGTP